jgi:hypothetical protein
LPSPFRNIIRGGTRIEPIFYNQIDHTPSSFTASIELTDFGAFGGVNSNYQGRVGVSSSYATPTSFEEVKFHFLKSDKYNLEDREDFIPQTIAQQDDKAFGFLNLQAWTEEEEESTLPFPGKDKFEQYYMTYELKNLKTSSNDPKDYESKSYDSLTEQAGTLQFESLNSYKIRER